MNSFKKKFRNEIVDYFEKCPKTSSNIGYMLRFAPGCATFSPSLSLR